MNTEASALTASSLDAPAALTWSRSRPPSATPAASEGRDRDPEGRLHSSHRGDNGVSSTSRSSTTGARRQGRGAEDGDGRWSRRDLQRPGRSWLRRGDLLALRGFLRAGMATSVIVGASGVAVAARRRHLRHGQAGCACCRQRCSMPRARREYAAARDPRRIARAHVADARRGLPRRTLPTPIHIVGQGAIRYFSSSSTALPVILRLWERSDGMFPAYAAPLWFFTKSGQRAQAELPRCDGTPDGWGHGAPFVCASGRA